MALNRSLRFIVSSTLTCLLLAFLGGCSSDGRVTQTLNPEDLKGFALFAADGSEAKPTSWTLSDAGELEDAFDVLLTGVPDPAVRERQCRVNYTMVDEIDADVFLAVSHTEQRCAHGANNEVLNAIGTYAQGRFTPLPLEGDTAAGPSGPVFAATTDGETVAWLQQDLGDPNYVMRAYSAPLQGGQRRALGIVETMAGAEKYHVDIRIAEGRVYFSLPIQRTSRPEAPIQVDDRNFSYDGTPFVVYSSDLTTPDLRAEATDASHYIVSSAANYLLTYARMWQYGERATGDFADREVYSPRQVISETDGELRVLAQDLKPRVATSLGTLAQTTDGILFSRGRTLVVYNEAEDSFTSYTSALPSSNVPPSDDVPAPDVSTDSDSDTSNYTTLFTDTGTDMPEITWLDTWGDYVVWTETTTGSLTTSLIVLNLEDNQVWRSIIPGEPAVTLTGATVSWWQGQDGDRTQRAIKLDE